MTICAVNSSGHSLLPYSSILCPCRNTPVPVHCCECQTLHIRAQAFQLCCQRPIQKQRLWSMCVSGSGLKSLAAHPAMALVSSCQAAVPGSVGHHESTINAKALARILFTTVRRRAISTPRVSAMGRTPAWQEIASGRRDSPHGEKGLQKRLGKGERIKLQITSFSFACSISR